MLVCIAPSGPIQPATPVYGPRRTGSRPSRISIARIFGAPVMEPPGNDAASRSNASRPASSRPVTVETRCWTAAVRSRRHRRGTRTLPGRQTRPRSLRRTSTIITFSARSLADATGARARAARSSLAVAAARAGALDRVGRDEAVGVERQERLRRGRDDRPWRAGQRARAEVEVRREERRVAGPEAPVERPRIAAEGRLEPARQVRLVELAVGDLARGSTRRRPRTRRRSRPERKLEGRAAGSARGAPAHRAGASQPRVDLGERARRAAPIARRPPGRRARPRPSGGPRR